MKLKRILNSIFPNTTKHLYKKCLLDSENEKSKSLTQYYSSKSNNINNQIINRIASHLREIDNKTLMKIYRRNTYFHHSYNVYVEGKKEKEEIDKREYFPNESTININKLLIDSKIKSKLHKYQIRHTNQNIKNLNPNKIHLKAFAHSLNQIHETNNVLSDFIRSNNLSKIIIKNFPKYSFIINKSGSNNHQVNQKHICMKNNFNMRTCDHSIDRKSPSKRTNSIYFRKNMFHKRSESDVINVNSTEYK